MNQVHLLRLLLVSLAGVVFLRAADGQVILPREGTTLNRIHVQFRWEPFDDLVGNYLLRIVEDDGSPDPFTSGNPTMSRVVSNNESRLIVQSGLEFGKDYAWKAVGRVGPPPLQAMSTVTRRFTTADLPGFIPTRSVTMPNPGPLQPGLILFSHGTGPMPIFDDGLILTVDMNGDVVHFLHGPVQRRIGDLRQLSTGHAEGRLVWILNSPAQLGAGGRAFETTIDGLLTWKSPDMTMPGGVDLLSVHHEVFPMPNGDYLALVQDDRRLILSGSPRDFGGDKIVQFDRHTKDVVWSWSTFDHYLPRDLHPVQGAADWTHANALIYVESQNLVYASMRSLSRITAIDYSTQQIRYNMGETNWASNDVTFGDNLFSFQHAVEVLPNGNVLLYDNGNEREPLADPRQSRAVELQLDDPLDPTTAAIVWQYEIEDGLGGPLYTAFVGDADRMPNGNTLVTVGRDAKVDEVDAAGNLLWRMQVGAGFPQNITYRAEKIDRLIVDTPGDSDGDWDLDMRDFAELQVSFTDSGPVGLSFPDTLVDYDRDDDIDLDDVDLFGFWMSGPGLVF